MRVLADSGTVVTGISWGDTIGLYTNWLRSLLPARSCPESGDSNDIDEWLVVSLDRDHAVFSGLLDPSVSGDWSGEHVMGPTEEFTLVDEFDDDFVYEDDKEEVEWAFGATEDRESDREFYWGQIYRGNAFEKVGNDFPLSERDRKQIDRDIIRAQPEHLRPMIFELLIEFARNHPKEGYTQGMHMMTSVLLEHASFDESKALLYHLADEVNKGYYTSDLAEFRKDLLRIQKFIRSVDASSRFPYPEDFTFTLLSIGTTDILLTVFTKVFSSENAARIFDIAFTLGRPGLFAVYLAALDMVGWAVHNSMEGLDEYEALVAGATVIRDELVRIGRSRIGQLLRRAKWYFGKYDLASLLEEDIDLKLQE